MGLVLAQKEGPPETRNPVVGPLKAENKPQNGVDQLSVRPLAHDQAIALCQANIANDVVLLSAFIAHTA